MKKTPLPLDSQRAYLRDALRDAGVNLNYASDAIGRNEAYLWQYISYGVPKFLSERDREALVRLYNLDNDKLKPPAVDLSPGRPRKFGINAVKGAYVTDTPKDIEFFRLFVQLPPDVRDAMLRLAQEMAPDTTKKAG